MLRGGICLRSTVRGRRSTDSSADGSATGRGHWCRPGCRLGRLIGLFYGTSVFVVIVVLGAVTAALRISIFRLLRYLREEFVLVMGTSVEERRIFLPGRRRG